MTETTIEKIARNRFATIINMIFISVLLAIIIKDFYLMFHDSTNISIRTKILHGTQFSGALIALLWLALLVIVSSMTMSGPAFKKTCPYTVTFLIVMAMEFIPRLWGDQSSSGWMRWFWFISGALTVSIILLQMLAFSLDPHSSSIFAALRPFRIEVLTVIQLSAQSPSIKRAERSSIV